MSEKLKSDISGFLEGWKEESDATDNWYSNPHEVQQAYSDIEGSVPSLSINFEWSDIGPDYEKEVTATVHNENIGADIVVIRNVICMFESEGAFIEYLCAVNGIGERLKGAKL